MIKQLLAFLGIGLCVNACKPAINLQSNNDVNSIFDSAATEWTKQWCSQNKPKTGGDINANQAKTVALLVLGGSVVSNQSGVEGCAERAKFLFRQKSLNFSRQLLSQEEREILGQDFTFSLEPLRTFTNLTSLHLSNLNIVSLDALRNLTNLQTLALSDNKITDVTALKNLKALVTLDLGNDGSSKGNQIYDISPLASLMNISYLNLNGNPISAHVDTCPTIEGTASTVKMYCLNLGVVRQDKMTTGDVTNSDYKEEPVNVAPVPSNKANTPKTVITPAKREPMQD